MRTQRGWTLIELVIAATAATVLVGIAVPGLSGALEAARAEDARGALLASLAVAATRAGITGTRAVLCPSLDGEHCSDGPDWSHGWLVFLDPNASRELDGGERVLRIQQPLAGRVRLLSTVGRTRIVFQGNAGNAGSNVTFTLCDGRGPARARSLVIANQGRLRDGAPSAEGIAAACAP